MTQKPRQSGPLLVKMRRDAPLGEGTRRANERVGSLRQAAGGLREGNVDFADGLVDVERRTLLRNPHLVRIESEPPPEADADPRIQNLDRWKADDLRKLAGDLGLDHPAKATKAELIESIQAEIDARAEPVEGTEETTNEA